ncbi:MAG: hypothetical protein KF819_20910 [Labilithrix sp.]|nr:hypothetical protein [Labilithrix sp.]
MKTVRDIIGFALLAVLTGCAAETSPVTVLEPEESISAAATTDEATEESAAPDRLEQAVTAPRHGDLTQCASCGPGPQPWYRTEGR